MRASPKSFGRDLLHQLGGDLELPFADDLRPQRADEPCGQLVVRTGYCVPERLECAPLSRQPGGGITVGVSDIVSVLVRCLGAQELGKEAVIPIPRPSGLCARKRLRRSSSASIRSPSVRPVSASARAPEMRSQRAVFSRKSRVT